MGETLQSSSESPPASSPIFYPFWGEKPLFVSLTHSLLLSTPLEEDKREEKSVRGGKGEGNTRFFSFPLHHPEVASGVASITPGRCVKCLRCLISPKCDMHRRERRCRCTHARGVPLVGSKRGGEGEAKSEEKVKTEVSDAKISHRERPPRFRASE